MTFNDLFSKGYVLHSTDKGAATFIKKGILLTITEYEESINGVFSANYGVVELRIGPFPLPNKNFTVFEIQMLRTISKLEEQM